RLASRRITDAAASHNPSKSLIQRQQSYAPGDTDLAWSRITTWRALLASALDQPPYEPVRSATVTGGAESPSSDLLAGWLAAFLQVPVKRVRAGESLGSVVLERSSGLGSVVLERSSGLVSLMRPAGESAVLTQPGQPDRAVALSRRLVKDCLTEEMRRLDADEVYAQALQGLSLVKRSRASTTPRSVVAPRVTK
ncbi:MAG: glucose-6-phosphate dehydrogenase assembly protein OpcA, partial [Mycobacteriaceae bacterium]